MCRSTKWPCPCTPPHSSAANCRHCRTKTRQSEIAQGHRFNGHRLHSSLKHGPSPFYPPIPTRKPRRARGFTKTRALEHSFSHPGNSRKPVLYAAFRNVRNLRWIKWIDTNPLTAPEPPEVLTLSHQKPSECFFSTPTCIFIGQNYRKGKLFVKRKGKPESV